MEAQRFEKNSPTGAKASLIACHASAKNFPTGSQAALMSSQAWRSHRTMAPHTSATFACTRSQFSTSQPMPAIRAMTAEMIRMMGLADRAQRAADTRPMATSRSAPMKSASHLMASPMALRPASK